MKKIIFILLTLITLTACNNQTISLEVNEPLEFSVNIKENAEFILIKEGTSINEATQIIKDNLNIETNADSYELDWYGEALSNFTKEEYETEETMNWSIYNISDKKNIEIAGEITQESSQKNTLNHDSFRPIELIIDFTKDGETKILYKQILLCVAKEDVYNSVLKNNDITVEDVQKTVVNELPMQSYYENYQMVIEQGYASNLQNYYFE